MCLKVRKYAPNIDPKPSITLICEDKAIVKEYFEKMQENYQNIFTIEIIPAEKKTSAIRIAQKAIEVKGKIVKRKVARDFQVCCIFDIDNNTENDLTTALQKCKDNDIDCLKCASLSRQFFS